MTIAQTVVYRLKTVTGAGPGRILNRAAKVLAGFYFDLFIREYRPSGMSFAIPVEHTTREMRGKFTVDTYELPERTLVQRYMPPQAAVLELGACIGVVSCFINRGLADPKRHVAVEANPGLIATLLGNRDRNNAGFEVLNAVVSRDATAFISTDKSMDSNGLQSDGTPVETTTVEAIERAQGWTFNTLVMDIEGGEYAFVRENPDLLKRLALAVIEFHPPELGEARTAEIKPLLAAAGLAKVDQMLTVECWRRV